MLLSQKFHTGLMLVLSNQLIFHHGNYKLVVGFISVPSMMVIDFNFVLFRIRMLDSRVYLKQKLLNFLSYLTIS